METQTKQAPEKKFRAGAIAATVWKNEGTKGSFRTVQLARAYRDKNEAWKHTSSFRVTDLPKVALVANKAYEYLAMAETEKETDSEEISDLL